MLKKKMSDVSEQIRGVSYKPEDILSGPGENAIGILRANNIADGAVNFDDLVYVKKSKVSQKQMLRKGDILICTSSGSKNLVGKAAQIEEDCNYSFGAFCKVIRPQKINPGFLGMYFQSSLYRQYISEVSQGANINNIKNVHIDAIEIEGYSENEQKKIAELLERIVKIIKIRKQQISVLDTLIKSRFIELFGDPLHPVHSRALGDVAVLERGRFSPRPRNDPRYYEGDYPFIQTGDIAGCGHRLSEYRQTLNEKGIHVSKKFSAGTIVIAIVGATIGATAILEIDVYAPDSVIGISVNDELYNNVFMEALLQFWQPELVRIAPESARANINLRILQSIPIIDVELPRQLQFASFVEQTDKSKVAVRSALDKAQLLFDSLMQKYFG